MPRLVAAIIGHLVLFTGWRDLFLWQGRTLEAWEFFRTGSISGVILVFTVAVLLRGTAPEKVAALGLSILPAFCLFPAFVAFAGAFR